MFLRRSTLPFLPNTDRLRHGIRCLPLCWLVLLLATGCQEKTAPPEPAPGHQEGAATAINLGIGSMITPKEGYIFYKQMGQYLEQQLHQPVTIADRGTYDAFNNMLQEGQLDIAFACGGPYVEGAERFGLQLLVKPETLAGETVYYSLILVPADSLATTLNDLRGKSFAFADPKSNTGFIVPSALLARMGETPQTFFGQTSYTYAHDRSIRAVAEKVVDGAAVDSLIYDYLTHTEPKLTDRVRVLLRSEPYGIPPVVIRPGLAPELRERLRTVLLAMDQNPEGEKILKGMLLRRFVAARDSDYDTIRRDRALILTMESP